MRFTAYQAVPSAIHRAARGGSCYWARLRGFGGELDDVITNGFGSTPPVVTISPTDLGFEATTGCGTWTRIS